jgi:hypothetical protein
MTEEVYTNQDGFKDFEGRVLICIIHLAFLILNINFNYRI